MSRCRYTKDEIIEMIMECRNSGLSDYVWCEQKGINTNTFSGWIHRLKKTGFKIPISDSNDSTKVQPSVQEVVKLDIIPSENNSKQSLLKQNTCIEKNIDNDIYDESYIKLAIGDAVLSISNGADKDLVSTVVASLGGVMNVR